MIEIIAAELDLGETGRYICPECQGGSSSERSLSVTLTEDNVYLWQCFRAKCEYSGASGGDPSQYFKPSPELKKARPTFNGRTSLLRPGDLKYISETWGIENPPYWYWTYDYGGRVAMSIRSPKYMHRGWVLRDIHGTARNKALTFVEDNEEGLSWYKTHPHAPTVLVEDIPSAVRATSVVNSVALLGTGIGLDRAAEIAEYATRPIVVALDQDATDQSFKWAHKYALLWGDVKVLPLKKDLKDTEEREVQQLLENI